jgi:[FeFe] hydrogenase H-cluster maturation GTPase HydF
VSEVKRKSGKFISVSTVDLEKRDLYLDNLKRALIEIVPDDALRSLTLIGDLLPPGGMAVLVVPIDLQAPKGRLILPQVQTIRDALDNDACALVVKERELTSVLNRIGSKPDLVVCDSQAVLKVTADVPVDVPCTTFSILFARQKGDLAVAAEGGAVIETLQPGDRVLIAEACSHHALQDDIGRIKIPRWLRQFVGGELQIDVSSGRDYPAHLSDYKLVIHCGACMLTRREMLNRIALAREAGVAVTNYGIAISVLQGVIKRTLAPFPYALMAYERGRKGDSRG